MEKEKLLGLMKGQLIVSCQALPGEAFYDETISLMDRFAIAAQRAGAAMIRANGLRDIQAVKKATGLPVIGLIKKEYPGYDAYITPVSYTHLDVYKRQACIPSAGCRDQR